MYSFFPHFFLIQLIFFNLIQPWLSRDLHSPLLITKFCSRNSSYIPMLENKCGNFSFISASISHVSSSIRELLHNTLTKGTLLFLNNFSSRSKILTGLVSMVKSPLIFKGTCGNILEGSILAFRNNDTWNTLWLTSWKCSKLGHYKYLWGTR